MPIVFLEINSLITFFLQNPSSSAVGIRTVVIDCSAVDSYPIPVFWHRARPPNMDTHSFGPKKYQKKGQKNRKKGEKSCQEYQWYINYWPPWPGFGPKNGQKGTKTNLKTTYSKNHGGHINYLPTCFTKKKTFDTRDSRVVPHRSTDRAQWCLTAQFGWDAVYPPLCDRMMRCMILWCMPTRKRKNWLIKKK